MHFCAYVAICHIIKTFYINRGSTTLRLTVQPYQYLHAVAQTWLPLHPTGQWCAVWVKQMRQNSPTRTLWKVLPLLWSRRHNPWTLSSWSLPFVSVSRITAIAAAMEALSKEWWQGNSASPAPHIAAMGDFWPLAFVQLQSASRCLCGSQCQWNMCSAGTFFE